MGPVLLLRSGWDEPPAPLPPLPRSSRYWIVSAAPSAVLPASPLLWRTLNPSPSLARMSHFSFPFLPLHLLPGSLGLCLVVAPSHDRPHPVPCVQGCRPSLPSWRWSPAQLESALSALATPKKVTSPPSITGQCPTPAASWAISSSLASGWCSTLIYLEAASVICCTESAAAQLQCG